MQWFESKPKWEVHGYRRSWCCLYYPYPLHYKHVFLLLIITCFLVYAVLPALLISPHSHPASAKYIYDAYSFLLVQSPGNKTEFQQSVGDVIGIKTEFRQSIGDVPLWQDVIDDKARVMDLYSVSYNKGRFNIHGLTMDEQRCFEEHMRSYKFWGVSQKDGVMDPPLNTIINFTSDNLHSSSCTTFDSRTVFILARWVTENTYHMHNDNLLAIFANMYQASSIVNKSQLALVSNNNLYHPIGRTAPTYHHFAPNTTALYYFIDNNEAQKVYWNAFNLLFDSNVYSMDSLNDGQIHCFKHVRWGRGPLLLYLNASSQLETSLLDPGPKSDPHNMDGLFGYWTYTVQLYQQFILRSLGISPREITRPFTTTPRVTMITRSSHGSNPKRWMRHRDVLANVFRNNNVIMQECCDWANTSLHDVVNLAHHTDILIGLHGAGLANGIYLPPHSMIVEFADHFGFGLQIFDNMALHTQSTFLKIDVRVLDTGSGYNVTETWAEETVPKILKAWLHR